MIIYKNNLLDIFWQTKIKVQSKFLEFTVAYLPKNSNKDDRNSVFIAINNKVDIDELKSKGIFELGIEENIGKITIYSKAEFFETNTTFFNDISYGFKYESKKTISKADFRKAKISLFVD